MNQLVEALRAKDPERFTKDFHIGETFNGHEVIGISSIPGRGDTYDLQDTKTKRIAYALDYDMLVLIKSGLLSLEVTAETVLAATNTTSTVEE